MFLFSQKDRPGAESGEKKFYILSPCSLMQEQLCQQFRLAGFNAVEGIDCDITRLASLSINHNISGVVIDIGDSARVTEIVDALHMQIPRKVWCCVVGNSDSIALAQAFAQNQVGYFHLHTQQEMMVQAALSGVETKSSRVAVRISVLGCKGGIGSTTIAWQLAEEITRIKQLSTLFIQGGNGSHDLEFYAGKKLTQEITPLKKHFDLMPATGGQYPELPPDTLQNYNFLLFEQAINTADKELMRQIAESSSCLVLVIDRSLVSIRVARMMIENVELLYRSSHTPRRLFICLNDTRPIMMDALSQSDIESLLNRPVDIVFPYYRRKKTTGVTKSRLMSSPLAQLTSVVLGSETQRKNGLINRLLSSRLRGK